jgi:DNA-binding Xre family transcriptional regulator
MSGATLKIDPSKLRKHYLPPTKPCRSEWSEKAQYEAKVIGQGRSKRSIKTSRPAPQPKVVRKKEKEAKAAKPAQPTSWSTIRLDVPRIKNIMADKGMKVIDLADAYGVGVQRMYFILSSEYVTKSAHKRMAKVLGADPEVILLEAVKPPKVKRERAKREKTLIDKHKVEALLKRKKWLKKDLAEALGISQQALYNTLCRGRTSKRHLCVMAEALGVLPSDIQPEGNGGK